MGRKPRKMVLLYVFGTIICSCVFFQFSLFLLQASDPQKGLLYITRNIVIGSRPVARKKLFFASSPYSALAHSIALDIDQKHPKYSCINLNTGSDSWGLLHDLNLYSSAFPTAAIKKNFYGEKLALQENPARINFYVEIPPSNRHYFPNSNYPVKQSIWLMVNPEWFFPNFFNEEVAHIGVIVAKTRIGVELFKKYRQEKKKDYAILYTKHTSQDIYDPSYKKHKKWNEILHLGGKSKAKNTKNIILAWVQHPHWPKITIRHRDQEYCDFYEEQVILRQSSKNSKFYTRVLNWLSRYRPTKHGDNIDIRCGFLVEKEVLKLQNQFGIHICPSESEGFGHYINEARASGALVITSNVPPMNEFVTNETGILIGNYGEPMGVFDNPTANITPDDIADGMRKLVKIPIAQRKEMGKKARKLYLQDRATFYSRMAKIYQALCGKFINLEYLRDFLL